MSTRLARCARSFAVASHLASSPAAAVALASTSPPAHRSPRLSPCPARPPARGPFLLARKALAPSARCTRYSPPLPVTRHANVRTAMSRRRRARQPLSQAGVSRHQRSRSACHHPQILARANNRHWISGSSSHQRRNPPRVISRRSTPISSDRSASRFLEMPV